LILFILYLTLVNYYVTYIDIFIKREVRFWISLLPFLGTQIPSESQLATLENDAKIRISPMKYNKYGLILHSITVSIHIAIMALIFPVLMYELFWIFYIDFALFFIFTFLFWIFLFTFCYRKCKEKEPMHILLGYKGLYGSLFVLFFSTLVIMNTDTYILLSISDNLDSYTVYVIEQAIFEIKYTYGEIILQWSVVQGIIFSYLDYENVSSKTDRKTQENQKSEIIKDTDQKMSFAVLKYKLYNQSDNKDDLIKFIYYLYVNLAYRKSIISLTKQDYTIIPLPSFKLEDKDINGTFAFLEKLSLLFDGVNSNDVHMHFAKDILFHKKIFLFLNNQKCNLKLCNISGCFTLFISEHDDICPICRSEVVKKIIF